MSTAALQHYMAMLDGHNKALRLSSQKFFEVRAKKSLILENIERERKKEEEEGKNRNLLRCKTRCFGVFR